MIEITILFLFVLRTLTSCDISEQTLSSFLSVVRSFVPICKMYASIMRQNGKNLPQPSQMELPKNLRNFLLLF